MPYYPRCTYCGKVLKRSPSAIRNNKTGLFFCNQAEAKAYNKTNPWPKTHPGYMRGWRASYAPMQKL